MAFIKEGGMWFTLPILIMGIVNLVLFIYLVMEKANKKDAQRKRIDLILFLGSFAFIMGIFGQVLGFYQAASAIQEASEIAPSLIWGGVKVSLIAPIMGFVVLLCSSIFWFILKPAK
jgi:uncharacterized membrane protein YjfL (UPF0719 family)